ncbi:tripartite tricarboxylate transporter substrate binding protein [Comamonadaceae bacterium G21597-S1]|nr:tripartite tricarboxylate transporter substrate binding protein [Comamonadaceae bacterium G21597-S1]
MMSKRHLLTTCAVLALGALAPLAQAQEFPNKPVRILVPFPAGGAVDIIARLMSTDMATSLGTSVVVENRPGASGNIAFDAVAKAPGDGHTLIMASASLAINKSLIKSTPFDPRKDFTPIGLVAMVPSVLVVNKDLPVNTVQELIAHGKAHPGTLNYGSNGNGTTQHLAATMFSLRSGVPITHVPYKGVDQLLPDLVSGRIQLSFNNVASMQSQLKAGNIRALAVGREQRWAGMPQLPTYQEAGIGGLEYASWVGLLGPAGLPAPVIDKLSKAMTVALANPQTRERIEAGGNELKASSPSAFGQFFHQEIDSWAKAIAAAGLKAE